MGDKVGIACLCGKVKEQVQLKESIPVTAKYCHCNSCRHTFGALCHSALAITKAPNCVDVLSKYYDPSVGVIKYFCGTCGAHVCQYKHRKDTWDVKSGIVDQLPSHASGKLENVAVHQFLEDTKDGGLSVCFTTQTDPAPQFFMQEMLDSAQTSPKQLSDNSLSIPKSNDDRLHGLCHCGGVQFFLTRPDDSSKEFSSPWPDLVVPYHSRSRENPEDAKWWIRGRKWLAGTCACRSCRLGLGSPIQAWTFVSRSNLFEADGKLLSYNFGTLKRYESSPEKFREFCSKCGATIFWHCAERSGVVDVSVGVLRGKEGARAREWLDWWTERISFSEEALDQKLIRDLEAGLRELSC